MLSKCKDRITMSLMSSGLKHTAHLRWNTWESYQHKDILTLTLILVQPMQPVARVLPGVLFLPSLECLPGLLQLSCHALFKLADKCLGFNLFINIPDIFKCQRLLVAFQNNTGTRVTHRLGQRLSPCRYQNLPPSSMMEGQKDRLHPCPTTLLLHLLALWSWQKRREGKKELLVGDRRWEKTARGRGGPLLNQEPKEHCLPLPCSFFPEQWLCCCANPLWSFPEPLQGRSGPGGCLYTVCLN